MRLINIIRNVLNVQRTRDKYVSVRAISSSVRATLVHTMTQCGSCSPKQKKNKLERTRKEKIIDMQSVRVKQSSHKLHIA